MPGVRARYWNAGHLLGSASIEIEFAGEGEDGKPLRVLASGDLGPDAKLLQPEPEAPTGLDYVLCELTYGDEDRPAVTRRIPPRAARRGSVRRSQSRRRAAHSGLCGRAHPGADRRSGRPDGARRDPGGADLPRFAARHPRHRSVPRAHREPRIRRRRRAAVELAAPALHRDRGREQVDRPAHRLPHHHRRQRHVRRRPHPPSSQALAVAIERHRADGRLPGAGHARAHPARGRQGGAHHGRTRQGQGAHPPHRRLFRPCRRPGAGALDRRRAGRSSAAYS